jgi:uncharacterized protein
MTRILWSRTDKIATEFCKVFASGDGWNISGRVVLFEQQPGWLEYSIDCAHEWVTSRARVQGDIDGREIDVTIRVEDERWSMNGSDESKVHGCVDVDLNFSPSTNLLPIKRLALEVGESATVRAAWLRFPMFTLEPLEQTYTRLAENEYRYASGNFEGKLLVDDFGLPVDYAGVWKRVAT